MTDFEGGGLRGQGRTERSSRGGERWRRVHFWGPRRWSFGGFVINTGNSVHKTEKKDSQLEWLLSDVSKKFIHNIFNGL